MKAGSYFNYFNFCTICIVVLIYDINIIDLFQFPKLSALKDRPKLYMSHNDFKSGTPEAIFITHVVSPDKFYVRKVSIRLCIRYINDIFKSL